MAGEGAVFAGVVVCADTRVANSRKAAARRNKGDSPKKS
jgi:hypothetical protein